MLADAETRRFRGSTCHIADVLLANMRSPWFSLIADLYDVVLSATVAYGQSRGLRALCLPLTTRTVTCPSGLGSDSSPVAVNVNGVDTYLSDSLQFPLEYGCRLSPAGCYTVMPSFRSDEPDMTHLNQFIHSEAEIPGGLDELISYVEGYIKHLADTIMNRCEGRLGDLIGDTSHVEKLAAHSGAFEHITFAEAVQLLAGEDNCVMGEPGYRWLTRRGERRLMEMVSEFLWVSHFDYLAMPFYHGFGDPYGRTASNADLFFGMGEIVGSGARHRDAADTRQALAMRNIPENDYAWYVHMKSVMPMQTSGFGMGVERFLMWVLRHDDIRDIPLISRTHESASWPRSVDRP